jgi:hypothetical protein
MSESAPQPNPPQVQHQLDQLVSRGRSSLRRHFFQAGLRLSVQRFLWTCLLSSLVYCMLAVLGRAFKTEMLRPALPTWLLFAGVLLLGILGQHLFTALRQRFSRRKTLANWDHEFQFADRLNSADQFLEQAQQKNHTLTGFQLAAVEDAQQCFAKTSGQHLHPHAPRSGARGMMALLAACFLFYSIGAWSAKWAAAETVGTLEVAVPAPAQGLGEQAVQSAPNAAAKTELPEWKPRNSQTAGKMTEASTISHSAGTPEQEDAKQTPGSTQSGRSAAATASTGSGNAQGTPTKQGQISEQSDTKTKAKPKKPKKQKPHKPNDKLKAQEEEQSGATSGRGSSRGSNRNPAASDWSSRDHVNTPDDDDLDSESDVEDDEEEQEARGGMQPSLRDRRPPVSRDLQIGFGNRPNPDANGRGGPSQQKKSRGTASLVLGVPIPDRIKGQPNPGRTKITQEAVQPQVEAGQEFQASPRQPRSQATSALHRSPMQPWLQQVVRNYFLQRRAQSEQKS